MTTRNRELASIIDASGNITTGGNLSVAGNLTQTNSTTTSYSDGLLELNSGAGSNSNDLGLVMERGSTGDNAIFLWDESNDGFAVGTTTAVGSATGNISFSAAPFTASTITGTILTGSTSVKTPLIEYTDGDDAITIADGGHITTGANLSIGGSNNELRFYEGSNYVGFEAPALSADQIWVLPTADGSSGQILKTDGSGNLSFTDDLTLANASVNNFSGNGSATGFTLSTTPVSENATQVYINGVYQFKNTYSVSGTTLTFDAAPPNGSSIEALVWSTVAINTPADASVTNSSLNASVITSQSEVTAADADHILIYDASATALKKALVSDLLQTDEEIQDIIGAMFSSNTETGISVTYQDGDGTLDLVIGDDSIVSSMLDTNIDIAGTLDVTGVLTTDTNATIAGTLGIAGGSSNGVQISQGAIAIKNGGSKSYIDLYCESSNAHYTRIEAAAHSAYSGNVTVTLPVATGTLALTSGSVATVTGAAQSAITSLGTLTALDVDNINLNGNTLTTTTSDFIIDASHDIILDADGANILLKDGGTQFGEFENSSNDFRIKSVQQDKDIIFRGNDGGTYINALTLDMSEAGAATFNGTVTLPSNIIHTGDTDTIIGFDTNTINYTTGNQVGMSMVNGVNFMKSASPTDPSGSAEQSYIYHDNAGNTSLHIGAQYQNAAAAIHLETYLTPRLSVFGSGDISVAKSARVAQVAITSSSNAVAWDAKAAQNAYHVTTENTTFSAPSNAVEGAVIQVEIAQGSTARTIAWNTVFEFAASTAPTVTATANKTDIFTFRYNGSVWQEIGRVQNMAQT
jgi:hypothetical protein